MKKIFFICMVGLLAGGVALAKGKKVTYPIVDTGQVRTFNNTREIVYPKQGGEFFGQDAQYEGHVPAYRDNGNGTVTDLVTGLMWQKELGSKKTYEESFRGAKVCRTGGYNDWRLPTIKELYSLINFSGIDPDPRETNTSALIPFIDTKYFVFKYGDSSKGERIIDSQFISSTKYVHKTMGDDDTVFGVNFADGRIKGYPLLNPRTKRSKKFYTLYVRGNKNYGKNKFIDTGHGIIIDTATGLKWMQVDSGFLKAGRNKDGKLNWQEALSWAESLEYAGYSDWRLPTAKELQSIVDYTRSPATTGTPAISNVFKSTRILEDGTSVYPYFWTSTTHKQPRGGNAAVYISFGRGLGWMENKRTGLKRLLDVHGAGCQRSDPKEGDASKFPYGRGPQGDVLRINNFVRLVRGGKASLRKQGPKINKSFFERTTLTDSRKESRNTHPGFVDRLDRDGDGKISIMEFDGPSKHFSKLDRNKDGYLSENEAPKGPPKRRR